MLQNIYKKMFISEAALKRNPYNARLNPFKD